MSWSEAKIVRVGDMTSEVLELGEMTIACHRIPREFNSTPRYRGLPDDMCPCEHWCYLVSGELRYRFADGATLTVGAGEAFHVRSGHLADALADSELIELTRTEEYRRKAEHLARGRADGAT